MHKPRVYIETTIPGFYHESRTTPDVEARRDWTRRWWDGASARYDLVTSPAVLDELGSSGLSARRG
jgi:phage baseplate assembly protein gpV